MRKLTIAMLITLLLAAAVLAQKQGKPWVEWNQKEAEKILNDSPWGRTQTDTDTSQMFFSPTSDPNAPGSRGTSNDSSRLAQGATNQAVAVNYRIRFFTAKPIREALVRLIEVKQSNLPKETVDRLAAFANFNSDQYIIVAVTFDSTDQRFGNQALQAFASITTDVAKNNTYLERKDGKRIFLSEYVAPGKDGFGARFIFARTVDGQPFLTADSGDVRFYSEFPIGKNTIKLNMRYKVADMMYNGSLEY